MLSSVYPFEIVVVFLIMAKQLWFQEHGRFNERRNGLIGIVKYAAELSGSKHVIGREGWKAMNISKFMYFCGALAWY